MSLCTAQEMNLQFMGVDIGTSATRGLVANSQGEILCQYSVTNATSCPRPGWVEQDADEVWWNGTLQVIRRLLAHPQVQPARVAGIYVSGLFPAVLIADGSGRPLRPALLYSDNRAHRELAELNAAFGLQLTGDAVVPKLVWLQEHEPESFARLRYLFSSHNYILYRLAGAYCLDYKVADALGGLLDRATLRWRADVASWAGLSVSYLPHLCSETEIVGSITSVAARETGLCEDTLVIAGSGDSLSLMVSVGAIERGDALLSFGTTGWLGTVPHSVQDYLRNPLLLAEGSPYSLDVYLLALGSSLNWFCRQFAETEMKIAEQRGVSVYQILDGKAADVPAAGGGLTVLPYFLGGRSTRFREPEAGAIVGLTLSHTPVHVYRALLESFGYVIRRSIEREVDDGIAVQRIIATGGGAASSLWRQIVADITRKPLYHFPDADPCLGNAYLVAYALRVSEELAGIQAWLPSPVVTEPARGADQYDAGYNRFLALADVLSV